MGLTAISTALHNEMIIIIKNFEVKIYYFIKKKLQFLKESDEIASKFTVNLCDSITQAWSEIEDCGQDLLGKNKLKIFNENFIF